MKYIKNYTELATTDARNDALTIIEAGFSAIDTATVLSETLHIADDVLHIDGASYELAAYEHIYIIGFGKVSCAAARSLEQILQHHVAGGAVVGIKEQVCALVDTYAGTHPLPSSVNYTATKHITEIAQRATERDLVLVVVSGGGSALLCGSMGECEQGTRLFNTFLSSGGTIDELNVVRKHISKLKGGGLAAALHPATVVGLIFSDVPGGDLAAVASGPTFLDVSTIEDAQAIIEQYQLGDFTLQETPKDPAIFARVQNVPVVTNERALNAMKNTAEAAGYTTRVLSSTHYATPEETAALVQEHTIPKHVYLLGGESSLTVPAGVEGTGGRNDYVALSVLPALAEHQLFASVATDGHDNTDAAGAIVDRAVLQQAIAANEAIDAHVQQFDSYPLCKRLGAHIHTGYLESNVSDVMLILNAKTAPPPSSPTAACISAVQAKVVKDSRGTPTIAVTVVAGGHHGTFSVPSGASTGEREVTAIPAAEAVRYIKTVVAPAVIGMSVTDQAAIDATLHEFDGTDSFSKLGGNTALGVSVAALKAAAASCHEEPWQYIARLANLPPQAKAPRLFVNLINGGAHADRGSQIQEHQIIPETDNVHEAFRTACAVQRSLRDVLREQFSNRDIGIGDEGGFMVPSTTIEEPFTFLTQAIKITEAACPVSLGADIAASSFMTESRYQLNGTELSSAELTARLVQLTAQFPDLRYIEDPAGEYDLGGFARLQTQVPASTVIGDDLTTTNVAALSDAVAANAIQGIIIKPNQIGTVTDTLETMRVAYKNDIRCIVSHRSGETMDDFIADLAYGTKCFGLKAGAPTAEERLVKYQRLLKISTR